MSVVERLHVQPRITMARRSFITAASRAPEIQKVEKIILRFEKEFLFRRTEQKNYVGFLLSGTSFYL